MKSPESFANSPETSLLEAGSPVSQTVPETESLSKKLGKALKNKLKIAALLASLGVAAGSAEAKEPPSVKAGKGGKEKEASFKVVQGATNAAPAGKFFRYDEQKVWGGTNASAPGASTNEQKGWAAPTAEQKAEGKRIMQQMQEEEKAKQK